MLEYTGTGGFGQQGETTTVTFPDVTGSKARLLYLTGTGNAPIVYELSVYPVTFRVGRRSWQS